MLSVQSAGDHYSNDPVQVQSRSEEGEKPCDATQLSRASLPVMPRRCDWTAFELHVAGCSPRNIAATQRCAKTLGTKAPAKIRIVTLMRPIHGNL